MKHTSILTVALIEEQDIIVARQRARQISSLLGFDSQDQTRIATAVSEIARNASNYGKRGRVEFLIDQNITPSLLIIVRDSGPGITDLDAILEGRFKSAGGMGIGISGTRRLMDRFEINTEPQIGTNVTLGKKLRSNAPTVTPALFAELGKVLAATGATDPLVEMRAQNHELLQTLAELKTKQDESARLNLELEKTNRGVVALYAELDIKAAELTKLNAELEQRIAAAILECTQTNETLRQSQKMEAVGQLTGGIAHDFNNLLQIITGNLDILIRRLPSEDSKLQRAAENAMLGAQRAATLTQRLLAFSRKQPLAPKPLDTNKLVEDILGLMQRTLGEPISIQINLARDLWIVEVDENQLENALLNLAVNARDAMASGGILTITTANGIIGEGDAETDLTPGQYVSLSVSDTGIGMPEDTMSRVFEPFFTTKDVGKGTGLGLSMVYGFIKQSGGHIRLESSVGRGTNVILYLPRFLGKMSAETPSKASKAMIAQPGETILVIEDDADVRAYSCDALTDLGYTVLAASDGISANEFIDSNARIDLIFTDVVLTGALNGREIATQALIRRPGIPILFTTGYAREAIVHNERLDEGVHLLPKPFSFDDLASKIRECIQKSKQS